MILRYFPYQDQNTQDVYNKLDLVPWYNLKQIPSVNDVLHIQEVYFSNTEYELVVKEVHWIKPNMVHLTIKLI